MPSISHVSAQIASILFFKASTVCCEENPHCTDLNDVDKLNMYMYQHNLISEIIFEVSESTEQCLDFSGLR